ESGRGALLPWWRLAVGAGLPVSVDPCSAAGLAEVGAEAFLEWTSGADTAFPNLDEGRLLVAAESEPDAIVDRLLEHYRTVALKLGPSGVLVASRDGERLRLPSQVVEVV